MSKIVLLGDAHIGARSDAKIFHDHFEKFYKEVFFPFIDEHGIKHIIQMGDIFDKRKQINFYSLYRARKYFFDEIKKRDLTLHVLTGNHDAFFKNTLEINSPRLLLKEYTNIKVYDSPKEIEIGGLKLAILPWICSDNKKESLQFIENTNAPILLGHLEIVGFDMYKGSKNRHGFDRSLFKKFEYVLSGHFHTRSEGGNITYTGTPYEMTWSDWNDPKGFHTLDTADRSLDFIPNPNLIFHKIVYNDEAVETPDLKQCYVKVLVEKKTDERRLANFIEYLEEQNPAQLQVLDDTAMFKMEIAKDEEIDVEDTLTIIKNEVSSSDVKVSRSKLEDILTNVYLEAIRTQ